MVTFCSSEKISMRHKVIHFTIPRIDISSPTTIILGILFSSTTLKTESSIFIKIVVPRAYTLLNESNEIIKFSGAKKLFIVTASRVYCNSLVNIFTHTITGGYILFAYFSKTSFAHHSYCIECTPVVQPYIFCTQYPVVSCSVSCILI